MMADQNAFTALRRPIDHRRDQGTLNKAAYSTKFPYIASVFFSPAGVFCPRNAGFR
jgi:hypothetical protein